MSNMGIEAKLHKVKAWISTTSSRTIKDVQILNGKMATLGIFVGEPA